MVTEPDRYRVVAPYITVKTMTPDGMQIRGLHAGAPVPLDVEPAALEHHLTLGLIEPIPKAQARAVTRAVEAAGEPAAAGEAGKAAAAGEDEPAVAGKETADEPGPAGESKAGPPGGHGRAAGSHGRTRPGTGS